jgi:hypothetical protein
MAETGGRTIEMIIGGRVRTLGTIGTLASSVGRKSRTIRDWEHRGLIPPPPVIVQPGDVCTRRRMYPIELITAIQEVAVTEGFGRRRPSGAFLSQQERIWSTWGAVIDGLNSDVVDPGITGDGVRDAPADAGEQAQQHHADLDGSYIAH